MEHIPRLGEQGCGVTLHLSYSRWHTLSQPKKFLTFNLGANMVLQKTEGEGFLEVDGVCFGGLFLVLVGWFGSLFVCLFWGFNFFWLGFFWLVFWWTWWLWFLVWGGFLWGGILCFFKGKDFYWKSYLKLFQCCRVEQPCCYCWVLYIHYCHYCDSQ